MADMQYAFIDDSGDSGLDLSHTGTTRFFVVAAVLVSQEHLSPLKVAVEEIRKRHFQTGEMKSSGVGKKDRRRIAILNDLLPLSFHCLVGVTDKVRLQRGTGLEYHKSFMKFLPKQVHGELRRLFPMLQLIADQHGNDEFMHELSSYINNSAPLTLFDKFQVEFGDSKDFVLLQLADFIAGSVRYQFESQGTRQDPDFVRELMPRMTLREWPGSYENYQVDVHSLSGTHNERITSASIARARSYIEQYRNSETPEIIDRVIFLEYLLCRLQFTSPKLWTTTPDVLKHLNAFRSDPCDKHYLRSTVVAPLRDTGILIASSAQGYKIPVSEADLCEFFNRSLSNVKPMADRLMKCRQAVQIATNGELDLLNKPEYSFLRRLIAES